MNMATRRFLLAACLIAPISVGAQTKLTLGYTGANPFMGAFVAKDQGFFAKRGLDVTLQLVPVGSTLAGAMAGGSVQVGTLTPPHLLLAHEGGVPLQIVIGASLQSKSNPTAGILAREGSNIKTAADLRGKRVGVPGLNGVNHVVFLQWLKKGGVDPKQVVQIESAFPQMGDMMKGGQIDAAIPVEPFLGRITQSKVGYTVAFFTPDVLDSYLESFYTMTKDYVDKNPKVVADFRAAIAEAVEWIGKNETEARKSQMTYLKLPEPIAMSIKLPTFTLDVKPQDVQYWIDACKEFGVTKGTSTVAQILAK